LFLLFPQKFLKCPIFSSSLFCSISKNKLVILFGYCLKYISSIKNQKLKNKKAKSKEKKKKSFKEMFIGFCRRKLKQGKIGPNQLGLSSNLILLLLDF